MTFNEWMETLGNNALVHANCCRIAYEAGQKSRQAEIDELGKSNQDLASGQCSLYKQHTDLQKQVDKALEKINSFYKEGCLFHEWIIEAERALRGVKKQNKYDWALIPSHVKFMATDEDGMACGWLVEPHIVGNAWRNQSHLSAFFNLTKRQNPFRGDWRESLERRPDHVEQAPKEIVGAGQ